MIVNATTRLRGTFPDYSIYPIRGLFVSVMHLLAKAAVDALSILGLTPHLAQKHMGLLVHAWFPFTET